MFTCEWEILSKLILGTAWVSTLLFTICLTTCIHIENGENKWCEMLVNLPTLGVVMCEILQMHNIECIWKCAHSIFDQ